MIILHNIHDKTSREFVAAADPAVEVLDWYNDADRAAWLAAGGTLRVSAFPSVLLRHDTYEQEVDEGGTQTVEAGWDTVRLPESMDTPLPDVGEACAVGIYTYNGGWVYCRQAHTRMDYEPSETPALFSTWRPDTPDMIWIPNEPVAVDDERIYDGLRYRCIQAHTTQVDWRPDLTPTLWALVTAPTEEWAAGVAYVGDNTAGAGNGDVVSYQGVEYRCLQSHTSIVTWTPAAVPALWLRL